MLKIYLVRHGQDQDNANGLLNGRRDEPLTSIGVTQAHEIANRLKESGIVFDKVYTSPLQRARETAGIVTETLGLPAAEIMPELIERDFGIVTGLPKTKIEEICAPDIIKTRHNVIYFLKPEGAETFPQLLQRASTMFGKITAKHPDGNVLLVTHGDFSKMVYAQYYGLDWADTLKLFHFGNSDMWSFRLSHSLPIHISTASRSTIPKDT